MESDVNSGLHWKLLFLILGSLFLVSKLQAKGVELVDSPYSPEKDYVVLIPGAGASAGDLSVKNLSKLLRVTGHGTYFSGYYSYFDERNINYTLCPRIADGDSRPLLDRALECIAFLHAKTRLKPLKRNIILIGHSMGGNIARMVAASPTLSGRIKAVLSISAPHRGTSLGDFVFEQYSEEKGWLDPIYRGVMEFIGFTPQDKKYFKELVMERTDSNPAIYLAQDVPDARGVQYYSIGNYTRLSLIPPLNLTKKILADEMIERGLDLDSEYGTKNDGVIPLQSMIWGKLVGIVESDHFEGVCIGILNVTPGCQNMKKLLFPFLDQIIKN
jgi:pimeloyl-ACP methyl ester carboxylesterase